MRVAAFLPLLFAFAASAAGEAGFSPISQPRRGVFEPRAEAVIPAEIAMTVKAMLKKAGDRCEKGDLLVEFDSSLPDAAVEAMRSKLAAEEKNHDGIRNLYERNQASIMELARAESDLAKARLEAAAARREAGACRVYAPFSGKIVEEKVREFEWADKGAPLLLLVDDSLVRARFFLPEEEYSRIRPGDRVAIRVPAVSRNVTGVVSRLGVVFDPVSRTFDVWADVDNADDTLRAGMTAEVLWSPGGDA
jgi:RND family efflux transporter MFP subunit